MDRVQAEQALSSLRPLDRMIIERRVNVDQWREREALDELAAAVRRVAGGEGAGMPGARP